MKKRLLSMAALLAASASLVTLSAQTDVTAEYFANPSFENGMEGWTVPTAESYTNNGTYKAGDAVPTQMGTTAAPSDGEYFFHTRHGWNGKSGLVWNLSTSSSQELPAGKYYLVCDYKAFDMCDNGGYHSQLRLVVSNGAGTEIAGTQEKQLFAFFSQGATDNNYINKADWSKIGLYFELTEATAINVGLNARLWSTQRSDMLYDNLRLYTCDEAEVTVNTPLDMTGCVPNARMEAGALVWAGGLGVHTNTNRENHSGFYMMEKWVAASGNLSNFDCTQTLTGLPNGKYRLSAGINATKQGAGNPSDVTGVTLYAGTKSVSVGTADGVPEVFTVEDVVADGTLKIGMKTENCTANWVAWDNVTLTYLGFDTTAAIAKLNELLAEAKTMAEANNSLASLLADLNAKIVAAETAIQVATKAALETATSDLSAAMEAYKAAVLPLANLKKAIAYNQNINDNSTVATASKEDFVAAIATAQQAAETATTIDELNAAIAALETARQTYVLGAYPTNGLTFDMTFKIVNAAVASSEGWSGTRMNSGESYDGAPDNTYFDIWNNNMNMTQAVSGLPEGVYSLKAATRAEANVTVGNIYVESDGTTFRTDIHHVGNTGNELGRGWGWTVVDGIMVSSGNINIGFYAECGNNKWAGADNFMLTLVRAFTAEEKAQAYIDALNATIAQAEAINTTANVGEGAFQHSPAAVETLLAAIATAKEVSTTDIETLVAAKDALKDAIAAYEASGLNEPAEGQVFNIIIRTNDGYQLKDIPWAFREDGKAGMFINKSYVGRPHLAQYVTFTKVEGTDNYILSTIFADGVERFVSTGAKIGGGDDSQIRLTDDSEKALVVKVIATETEGIYHLLNTAANVTLGCQDDKAEGGVYTTGAHSDVALVAVEKPAVTLKVTEAGFATVMLPYAVTEIPEGIKVYETEAAEEAAASGNRVLTLKEAKEIAANTPYIVEGEAGEYTFTGVGAAYKDTYEAGLLTGTFVRTTALPGTYVLQYNNGIAGFYRVAEGAEPTVGANRAYLTAPADASAEVTAFVFEGALTGIQGVDAAAAQVDVYTIDGVKVREGVKMSEALNGLSKGIYVVNGAKKAVK